MIAAYIFVVALFNLPLLVLAIGDDAARFVLAANVVGATCGAFFFLA